MTAPWPSALKFFSSASACVLVCCPFADGTGCDSSFSGYTSFLSDCP